MKQNKFLFAIFTALVFLASSCVDLDRQPLGHASADEPIESERMAFLRLTGVYSDMKDFRFTWSTNAFGDILSDDATFSGSDHDASTFALMESYLYQANHNEIYNKYYYSYQCINKANRFIQDMEKADPKLFDKYNKDHLIGEAKFLRAYVYFELVKTFGPVPLYTEVLALNHPRLGRSSVEDVYTVINKDLDDAVAVLPAKSSISNYFKGYAGRVVLGAAYALQTRVKLYQKDYEGVKVATRKILELGEYDLVKPYSAQFVFGGDHTIESFFEINMYESPNMYSYNVNNGNRHVLMSMPRNITYGFGVGQPSQALAKAYDEAGDVVRKKATLLSTAEAEEIERTANPNNKNPITNDRTSFYNKKQYLYPDQRAKIGGNNQPLNLKILRLGEVYLNYAEACALSGEEGEAKKYLNLIRERAELPQTTSSGDKLFEDIIKERRLELGMEGFRFFDIARIGWGPKVFEGFKEGREILPIPQREIDISKGTIEQTVYK